MSNENERRFLVIEATKLKGVEAENLPDPRALFKEFLKQDIPPKPPTPTHEKSNKL